MRWGSGSGHNHPFDQEDQQETSASQHERQGIVQPNRERPEPIRSAAQQVDQSGPREHTARECVAPRHKPLSGSAVIQRPGNQHAGSAADKDQHREDHFQFGQAHVRLPEQTPFFTGARRRSVLAFIIAAIGFERIPRERLPRSAEG